MLFYEKGRVYDTEDGSSEEVTSYMLSKAKKLGIQIRGLNKDKDWRLKNRLKLKALTGIDMRPSGITNDDLTMVDIVGNNSSRTVIVLSHYLRAVKLIDIVVSCDVILDNTLIFMNEFGFNWGTNDFTIDLTRLNARNRVSFVSALRTRLIRRSKDILIKPSFIKLSKEGYMSTLLYVLSNSNYFKDMASMGESYYKAVFEPYLSAMADIAIELYQYDKLTFGILETRTLLRKLGCTEFCSSAYFNCITGFIKGGTRGSSLYGLAYKCNSLLSYFGYLPDNLKAFFLKLEHILEEKG